MGIWQRIKRVFNPYPGGEITDEMRQKSQEIRGLTAKVSYLEKQLALTERLKDVQDALTGGDDDSGDATDKMFMSLVMGAFMKGQQPQQSLDNFIPQGNNTSSGISPKVDTIVTALRGKIPKPYMEEIVKLSDEEILSVRKKLVEAQYGNS